MTRLISAITLSACLVFSAIAACLSIVAVLQTARQGQVIRALSRRYEVTDESYQVHREVSRQGYPREFVRGYHAAMMDKSNLLVFREFYETRRQDIIFSLFEEEK